MVWKLYIYCFLNELYIGSFVFNIWCIENPYIWMDMLAIPFLKFNTNSIMFWFPQRTIKYDFFKNTSSLYWKCLATSTGLIFKRLHFSWYLKFFNSSSLSPRLFNLLIIYGSSSHLRSAHDNVRKYVGIPNCLTIARTSY